MKQWIQILDRLIYGRSAVTCALTGAVIVGFLILQPLPWRHFPNVIRMLSASWLYLLISGAMLGSALAAVAKRRGFPADMLTCLVVGVIWRFTPVFFLLPFNLDRLLIVYGLTGLVAHCIRRSRSASMPSIISSPTPEALPPGSDLNAKP